MTKFEELMTAAKTQNLADNKVGLKIIEDITDVFLFGYKPDIPGVCVLNF